MPLFIESSTLLTLKIKVRPEKEADFIELQSELNALLTITPGFISLEIVSPKIPSNEWIIVQRFRDPESLELWRQSPKRQELLGKINQIIFPKGFVEAASQDDQQGGVTQVFIAQVAEEKESEFRLWIAKMHKAEAKFPGFRGVYVQSPSPSKKVEGGKNWITLLQFDSLTHLDNWLNSDERQEILKESLSIVHSLDSERIISSYSGWFSSIAKVGEIPPVWKQTMLVLLVLYPIVMLEIQYLMPWLTTLDGASSTFIGNAISVSLISWPLMPIAIFFLGWWLMPKGHKGWITVVGTIIVLALYLIEIAFFKGYFHSTETGVLLDLFSQFFVNPF